MWPKGSKVAGLQTPSPGRRVYAVDHQTTTFTVTVRSLRPVSAETIKNMIEQKFEVIHCEETDQHTIGRQCRD